MRFNYDIQAPKRAANLSVNNDLLTQARALNINLSATLEESLVKLIKTKQQEAWLVQHQSAIAVYNQQADESGTFSDGLRAF